jgi:hypothetical protein
MTLTATDERVESAGCGWRDVLPTDRAYAAIPSARHPIIVAERDRQVLDYVRDTLLTGPPRAHLPAWLFTGARGVLAVPGAWRAVPSVHPDGPRSGDNGAARALASWLRGTEHRLLLLDHSHDPDGRFVVLLFEPRSPSPAVALKVATTPAASARVRAERDLLHRLDLRRLGPLADSVPVPIDPPARTGDLVLATTAASGVPMLVGYHRPGHTARPADVHADFTAAATWLRTLREVTAATPGRLGVPDGASTVARRQLATAPVLFSAVSRGLAAVDSALRRKLAVQSLVHGDFWAGNLLTRGSVVTGVVDWERAEPVGSPIRDLARFVLSYSYYLDRHTPIGRSVQGHPGLVADGVGAGVGYALDGTGWYPSLARRVLGEGLDHAGIPRSCGRDVVLAELAAVAAEAGEPGFARACWTLFARLSEAS